jgi:UDP-4-amino-4,6-dideoxy-N-acetyl-beta-L-altrosamine transaminase
MIPYGSHDINEADIAAVIEVLRGDWLTTGPMVERFEEALADWTGGVPAVSVSSGTAALHAAYAAAGLGPGDEVITPPITFVATQAALVHLGATPVFADVEVDTALIDPAAVESAITPRTKAIVAVDYAGHPADMERLRGIADRHKLLLIEDAAHSLGSTYKGRPVGALADITTFSFFPTKNITTGEGGAVASAHPQILERARRFSRQGLIRDPSRFVITTEGLWHQEVHEVGLNYRLTDVHAALGLSQLSRLVEFRAKRAQIKKQYDEVLSAIPGIEIPAQRADVEPMWHLYPLRVPAEQRRAIFESLRLADVGVQVNYLPAYRHPALAHLARPEEFPAAEEFYAREISIPLHTRLGIDQVEAIAQKVAQAAPKR